MTTLAILGLLYQLVIAAAAVFLLVLAWRFVRAHERIADALEGRSARDVGRGES